MQEGRGQEGVIKRKKQTGTAEIGILFYTPGSQEKGDLSLLGSRALQAEKAALLKCLCSPSQTSLPSSSSSSEEVGQIMASCHAFIFAWPLPSFPRINTLAAAVTHPTPSWHWQGWEGKGALLLPPSHQLLCQAGIQSATMRYCATRIACYCLDGVGKGSLFFCTVGASNLEQTALESAQRVFHYCQNKKCIIQQKDSMLLLLWRGFFLPPFWDIFTKQKRLRKPFK